MIIECGKCRFLEAVNDGYICTNEDNPDRDEEYVDMETVCDYYYGFDGIKLIRE